MASSGLQDELEHARLHYGKGEDTKNSLVQRKDSYELAGRIFLEISTKLKHDNTIRSAVVYLASTAISKSSALNNLLLSGSKGSDSLKDHSVKSESGSIPVAINGRLALDKFSKERIDGVSKIKTNTITPSTDLVNDLILLEQKLSEIGYTKAPVKSKSNSKTKELMKPGNIQMNLKRLGMPGGGGGSASINNSNSDSASGTKGNQTIQSILGAFSKDKVSESTYESVNQAFSRPLHGGDSTAKSNAYEMGFDAFNMTNLASSFSPLNAGNNENLVQLLSTIKRLNNENMSLIHRLEKIKAKEQFYDDARKDMESFKNLFDSKLVNIRQLIHDVSHALPPDNGLARAYLARLDDIGGEKNAMNLAVGAGNRVRATDADAPKSSKTSKDSEQLLLRQSQLEKMVDALVARLEKSELKLREKDKMIATLQKQLQQTLPIHVSSNNTSTVLKGSTSTFINTKRK